MVDTRPRSAADRDLRLLRLDHFNVPVRDLEVARKFYCEVLGGFVVGFLIWQKKFPKQLAPGEAKPEATGGYK